MFSFNRLFGREVEPANSKLSSPQLSEPLFVIGDIHGCHDQLETLLEKIWQAEGYDARIITVGDMIDRGADSSVVLQRLFALQRVAGSRLTCLKGNHEQMMLDFLAKPESAGLRWIQAGGLNTLESFNVTWGGQLNSLTAIAEQLSEALGPDLLAWLQGLPTFWEESNVGVVHAGADPIAPLSDQKDDNLIWGHSDFRKVRRPDGQWIVHGHTIVKEPRIKNGRISIDTGAYTGRPLTAVEINDGQIMFLQS